MPSALGSLCTVLVGQGTIDVPPSTHGPGRGHHLRHARELPAPPARVPAGRRCHPWGQAASRSGKIGKLQQCLVAAALKTPPCFG